MDWRKKFQEHIPGKQIFDEPLSAHTSFRIGGPADVICEPRDVEALSAALEFVNSEKIPFLIIGGGYNLLVSDKGFRGAVIKAPLAQGAGITFHGNEVTASAGLPLKKLVKDSAARGLAGVENLAGIPGAVGGAIYMNAGAYGSCIADIFVSAKAVSAKGGAVELTPEQLEFDYRESVLMRDRDSVVIEATFRLKPGDAEQLKERGREIIRTRNEKHPVGVPSAGSFFKNKRGLPPAGKLIEDAGLKGVSVGGAQVSEMHANFIVNTGGATCRDVLELMELVQDKVNQAHGIRLKPEVRIIK